MNNQFKNSLFRKGPPDPQTDERMTGGVQPAAPGERLQGGGPPVAQKSSRLGGGLFVPPWKPGAQSLRGAAAAAVAEQPTLKQPAASNPISPLPASPGPVPRTPDAYVQGQHGRYGPGPQPRPSSLPVGPQGPGSFAPGMGGMPGVAGPGNGPQSLASARTPYAGPGAFGAPAPSSAPGYNSFQQANSGPTLSGPGKMGMMVAPPSSLPGTFAANRTPGNGSSGERPPDGGRGGPPGRDPRGEKRKKPRRVPIWARVVIVLLIFCIVLGGGGLLYYQIYFANSVGSIVGQNVPRAKNEEDPNANLTNGILSGPRVNILLLGSDTDQKFQGTYIAQTDIVVTIDPASNTVGMLSIPRDFYINVPGYGMHKLDEAYGLGGVDLSRQTIEQDFGIPINYYAWVGLDGFIKVINEVGGVDVDVQHPIVDDNYPDDVGANANNPYALKRLYLAPGPQHLDGPTALEYVRSRHADLVGDFGRSVRQQQVLSALKTKLANPDIFGKLSDIAKDLQGYLKTDMQLADVLKLMNFARSLDPNKIKKLTLGPPYSGSGQSADGADVVIPNCAAIIPALQDMLKLGDKAACNIQANSGGSPSLPLAYMAGQPSALASSSAANLGGLLGNSVSGLPGNPSDLFGVQSLLDLLLMGIFESPDVF